MNLTPIQEMVLLRITYQVLTNYINTLKEELAKTSNIKEKLAYQTLINALECSQYVIRDKLEFLENEDYAV